MVQLRERLWGKKLNDVQQIRIGQEVRLSAFIRSHMEQILEEWEIFARTLIPVAHQMTGLALRDDAKKILEFIADDIESTQTSQESAQKSHGEVTKDDKPHPNAAEAHGRVRVKDGFNIVQMVSEYRALRASVIRLWIIERKEMTNFDLVDLTRFNEAIDQALAESLAYFTEKLDRSKTLFLGVLGHDMRNPLGAISMSAQLIQRGASLDAKQKALAAQIGDSALRLEEIMDQLIDLTRTRIGTGIPVIRAPMDIGTLARQMIDETCARFPERQILLNIDGDTKGNWDRARLGQVLSNLLGNAIQYSDENTPILTSLDGRSQDLLLSVHNHGKPIDPTAIRTLFDSLVRTPDSINAGRVDSTNLGLGLYIAREIAVSHGGTIAVTSSQQDGTVFTVSLPRELADYKSEAAAGSEHMLKVLIAEDETIIADMLEDLLVAGGYAVCGKARTVEDAVILADRHQPDLAVLDYRLANNGYSSQIGPRLMDRARMGILYASGHKLDDILTNDDGEAYIRKPYHVADLLSALAIVHELKMSGKLPARTLPKNFHVLTEARDKALARQ